MFNITVFFSGRGSNFLALYRSLKIRQNEAKITAVVADRNCQAVEEAKEIGIPTYFVSSKPKEDFFTYEELKQILLEGKTNLIVLAGFLKKIPDTFVDSFKSRIINIHPALLPSYSGKGMYGINVHKAVFNSRERYSGATVHIVDKIYDHGKILAQQKVDISTAKSPEEIAERVLEIEHRILPEVVRKIIEGKINLDT